MVDFRRCQFFIVLYMKMFMINKEVDSVVLDMRMVVSVVMVVMGAKIEVSMMVI